jgi:hypothetical protein
MNYVLLALIALVLLAGLLGFGLGHRRWSWGTVAAAVLVLLAATGYLYVASRMAAYEWSWTSFVRSKQVQLARQRDALVPDASAGGRLKRAADDKPLAELADERDRWQRALASIDTWRGRSWPQAAFQPPRADDQTGTIELPVAVPAAPVAADGEAAPAEPPKPTAPPPPLDPGSTVFVFEDVPAQDGGRYLGAFVVQGATFDAAANRVVLTVTQTEARDAYDSAAWKRNYDSVTVYDSLPADSWLAFSKTAERGDAAGVMPVAEKLSIDQVETLLEARDRQRAYLAEIEKHDEAVEDRDEWPRIRERLDAGEVFPGSYWAVVTFKEPYAVAEGAAAEDAPRGFETDETATFDLQTAFALADKGTVTIDQVRYRRPLRDARTFIHGGRIVRGVGGASDPSAEGIPADGVAALLAALRRDIVVLDESIRRLDESRTSITAELGATRERERRLVADATSWNRDAAAAARTAGEFEAELERWRSRLDGVTKTILALADELRAATVKLVAQIDAAAPPPARPTTAAP